MYDYFVQIFVTHPSDRPLIIQFSGNDPDTLLKAAKLVEHQCDGKQINNTSVSLVCLIT